MTRHGTGRWARMAIVALALGAAARASAQEPRVIEISAKRFEFTPNEITLKKGEPVTLRVVSSDVTHGFFQKPLGIDAVISPGKATDVTFTPQQAGRYTVICDHFCGAGHGNMHLVLVVE